MKKFLFALLTAAVAATSLVSAQAPDRSKPPQSGAPPVLKLPAIQKRMLSNGLPVWTVEHHGVPVVQVNLVVLSGTGDDPAGKFGIASLTASLLTEGAGSRSALQIADAVDFLGADLSTNAGSDASAVRLSVPVARLADALPIMADVALRPTFPQAELDRQKLERLTNIIQARDDPPSIGQLGYARVLYGTSHRYGTALAGSARSIQGFTVEEVRSFYRTAYQPANSAIIAVGDVTPARLIPMLERAFGGWKGTAGGGAAALPPAAQLTARHVYLIDKPGAAQSQVRIGWVGAARSTPDYFPLRVLNTILGEAFTSRLNTNLREVHGYAYGASSRFEMRSSAGAFYAAAGVQTDKTVEALKEFFSELTRIHDPVEPGELDKAKNYLAMLLPRNFETTRGTADALAQAWVYDLPADYYSTYADKVRAVTAADVKRVADTYIQPDKFAVVIVGDRKTIEPGVRALNLGLVTTVEAAEIMK